MLEDIKDALRGAGVPVCERHDAGMECFAVVRPQQILPTAWAGGKVIRKETYACVDYYFDRETSPPVEELCEKMRGIGWRVVSVDAKAGSGDGVVIEVMKIWKAEFRGKGVHG